MNGCCTHLGRIHKRIGVGSGRLPAETTSRKVDQGD
jgi:hypothetical protein